MYKTTQTEAQPSKTPNTVNGTDSLSTNVEKQMGNELIKETLLQSLVNVITSKLCRKSPMGISITVI